MKKIWGILILGLLFLINGCAAGPYTSKEAQKELIERKTIKIGMNYLQLVDILGYDQYGWTWPFKNTSKQYKTFASNYSVLDHAYLFKTDDGARTGHFALVNYKLIKIFENQLELYNHLLTIDNTNQKDQTHLVRVKNFYERKLKIGKLKAVQGQNFKKKSGTTYRTVGNMTYGSDGTSYKTVGNVTYGSDGSSSRKIGNRTIYSDGSSSRKVGNRTINSDGSSSRKVGNKTIYSSGRSCRTIGSGSNQRTICN